MFKIDENVLEGSTKFGISQEDKLIGIGHHRKMTSKEDKPYKKKTLQDDMKKALQEEDIIGIYPYGKMTSQKDKVAKKRKKDL